MNTLKSTAAAALLTALGLSATACSSTASTPTATPAKASTATAPATTTTAATVAVPAADCAILRPIAAGALTTLAPLASEPPVTTSTAIANYLTQLNTALANVTSAQGRTDLDALVSALKQVT